MSDDKTVHELAEQALASNQEDADDESIVEEPIVEEEGSEEESGTEEEEDGGTDPEVTAAINAVLGDDDPDDGTDSESSADASGGEDEIGKRWFEKTMGFSFDEYQRAQQNLSRPTNQPPPPDQAPDDQDDDPLAEVDDDAPLTKADVKRIMASQQKKQKAERNRADQEVKRRQQAEYERQWKNLAGHVEKQVLEHPEIKGLRTTQEAVYNLALAKVSDDIRGGRTPDVKSTIESAVKRMSAERKRWLREQISPKLKASSNRGEKLSGGKAGKLGRPKIDLNDDEAVHRAAQQMLSGS